MTPLKTSDTLPVEVQMIGQTGQYHSPRGAVLPATVVAARYIETPAGQDLELDLVVTRPGSGGTRPTGPFLETVRGARTGSYTAFQPHTFRPVS
ncbi:hypothetical protein SEA_BOLT007_41 [Arthrobacter phage Bolt007]|uniref:Uncharacterized protein n=1 Tax=Arthrobacter phage Bolt007 TaxID=3017297 RepID=A0AA49E5K5_9CAUD|nr:hypothetical protein SEA_BOLT007_41 [Arthrobacter phage Bolt007]